MKKMISLLTICLLMATGVLGVSADEWCYQESADVSTACGGLNTGNYSIDIGFTNGDNVIDGNWSTAGIGDTGWRYVYINYTVPLNSLNSSLWQIKDEVTTTNLSLNNECWSNAKLQLRVGSIGTLIKVRWECWNYISTSWFNLLTVTNDPSNVYEEAMWWNIGEQVSTECDYYVGDNEFNLSQITTTKTYEDSPTHKMYLACLYSLNGDSGYESMLNTQTCRKDIHKFNPNTEGNYTYNLAIVYRERQWNQTSHQWNTISEGTDNSLKTNFTVCDIPDDPEGWQGFIDWITSLLCQWFGWFC